MTFHTFDLERGQSLWENLVDINLTESGVHPLSLGELAAMGLDLDAMLTAPLVYVQTNGTPELRAAIANLYPGATAEHIEVTNGTSEANYVLSNVLLGQGGDLLFEVPNYLQVSGIAENLGCTVNYFRLRSDAAWEPDWESFEKGLTPRTRAIYVSHPNNPTGYVLSEDAIERIVRAAGKVGAWIIADEVYRGAEWSGVESPSFWGRSERVIVCSGLSKAYGLPGLRIGWIAGPPDIAAKCWARHDYTSIAPGAISDRVAQFAVQPAMRRKLFDRGREHMGANGALFADWVKTFNGFLTYTPPAAGAYAFTKYDASTPSLELTEDLRKNYGVFIVPGVWMGMEHYLRFGLGGLRDQFQQGLERIEPVLRKLAE